MHISKKKATGALSALFITLCAHAGVVSDFEDVALPTDYTGAGGGAYYDGADDAGGFASGGAYYENAYNSEYFSWGGWAASSAADTETAGYANQFSSIVGEGAEGSSQYGVGYADFFNLEGVCEVSLDEPTLLAGAYFSNIAYAYHSMAEGDDFAKKFGGEDGSDPDWLMLRIRGLSAGASPTEWIDVYLADYRYDDSELDYIHDQWVWVDLFELGEAETLEMTMDSSDTGDYGINTPTYFAMDSLKAAEAIGAEAETLGDGWKRSAWLGDFYEDGSGWSWHAGLGWTWTLGANESLYMYEPTAGWLWTAIDFHPWLCRISDGAWLWLDAESGLAWDNAAGSWGDLSAD